MKFKVRLIQSDEGFAVSCPSLPGCHSQGENEQEAIENIREAIILWLETFADLQDKSSDLRCRTDCRTIQKSALLKNI